MRSGIASKERSERHFAPGTTSYRKVTSGTVKSSPSCGGKAPLSTEQLAFSIFAAFRAHPHINNVLTHISRADWARVEQALNSIMDLTANSNNLPPLEQNIIDLMCADRGITGRLLKPYFHAALYRLVGPKVAERIIHHVETQFVEIERMAQQPKPAAPPQSDPLSPESGHAENDPR